MSTLSEQKRALKNTREFLKYLLLDQSRWTKRDLRNRASRCLKHYPFDCEIDRMIEDENEVVS